MSFEKNLIHLSIRKNVIFWPKWILKERYLIKRPIQFWFFKDQLLFDAASQQSYFLTFIVSTKNIRTAHPNNVC